MDLKEYIENQATEYCNDYDPKGEYYQYSQTAVKFAFLNGIKEYEKLELTIKFTEWLRLNYHNNSLHGWVPNNQRLFELEGKIRDIKSSDGKTSRQLYDYWLINIFKI